MPYRELRSSPDTARGNPALAMTCERLKDKLRVNGSRDELPSSVSRSESADALETWESDRGGKASPAVAANAATVPGPHRDERIP